MELDEIDRIDDLDAKIAFAKSTNLRRASFPWLAIRIVVSIAISAIFGIWNLLGLVF